MVNDSNINIKYYKERDKDTIENHKNSISYIKTKTKSLKETNMNNIPKDIDELKKIQRRNFAVNFLNSYASGDCRSKTKYAKDNKISIQTLNRGLEEIGHRQKLKKQSNDSSSEADKIKEENKLKKEAHIEIPLKKIRKEKELKKTLDNNKEFVDFS